MPILWSIFRLSALALAVLGVACGASSPGATRSPEGRVAAPATESSSRVLRRRAKVVFDLDGRTFPLPLVRGSVSGHPTYMLVDTGANSHVIAGWFAKKVGLSLATLGDVGTDHAGRSIATSRVEHPKVAIDGWGELADGPMLVTDVPPIIEKLGIGAFISPQRLTEEGDAVVLDLVEGELRAAWFEEAATSMNSAGALLVGDGARVCEDTASPIKGLAFVVPAKIDHVDAALLLDTGAQRSDLLAGSAAGRALGPRSVASKEQMYGASGKLTLRTIPRAAVVIGEVPRSLDVGLIGGESDAYCPRDGVLSMDVLRSCVLVLGRKRVVVRCGRR